jgi:uroporphyrin-3 C-methyltransferase
MNVKDDLMTELPVPVAKVHSRIGTIILATVLVLALIMFAWIRFRVDSGEALIPAADISAQALDRRLLLAEQQLARVEQERAALQQRLGESANRTNLLRDEVLGVSERAALIEDSVQQLSRSDRSAMDNLHLNEAELLLIIARERWQLSGDLTGTLQATELAATAINGLKDPQWLTLRQTVTRELAAYRAIETDPRAIARGELDALEALLPQLPAANSADPEGAPEPYGFERLLKALIRIQPTGQQTLIAPAERQAAQTALALEMANARTALQLRQSTEFKSSARRIDQWLLRLYADGKALQERRQRLQQAANAPLSMALPEAGSTLAELQRLKQSATP